MKFKRIACSVAVLLGLVAAAEAQGNMTIEYKSRSTRHLAGVVTDTSGAAVSDATVADCSADYKTVFASIKTDRNGHFAFSQAKTGSVHYLKIDSPGLDEVRIPVKIQALAATVLRIELHVGT